MLLTMDLQRFPLSIDRFMFKRTEPLLCARTLSLNFLLELNFEHTLINEGKKRSWKGNQPLFCLNQNELSP